MFVSHPVSQPFCTAPCVVCMSCTPLVVRATPQHASRCVAHPPHPCAFACTQNTQSLASPIKTRHSAAELFRLFLKKDNAPSEAELLPKYAIENKEVPLGHHFIAKGIAAGKCVFAASLTCPQTRRSLSCAARESASARESPTSEPPAPGSFPSSPSITLSTPKTCSRKSMSLPRVGVCVLVAQVVHSAVSAPSCRRLGDFCGARALARPLAVSWSCASRERRDRIAVSALTRCCAPPSYFLENPLPFYDVTRSLIAYAPKVRLPCVAARFGFS